MGTPATPSPHPLPPIPREYECAAPDAAPGFSRCPFLSDVICRIPTICDRPTAQRHPPPNIFALDVARRDDPLVSVDPLFLAPHRRVADEAGQGEGRFLSAPPDSTASKARLPTLGRVDAVKAYPLAVIEFSKIGIVAPMAIWH